MAAARTFVSMVVVASLALPGSFPQADQSRGRRSFASAGGRYELKPSDRGRTTWTLWDRRTEKPRYSIRDDEKEYWSRKDPRLAGARVPGELASQTVLISEDGRTVIALNDWPEIVEWPGETELALLRFFRDGTLVRRYVASDILQSGCSLSRSVSHANWLLRPIPESFPRASLQLTTTDLTAFAFDTRTGAIVARDVAPELRAGAVLVGAEIRKPRGGEREIVVLTAVAGSARAGETITVTVDEADPLVKYLDERRHGGVVIQDGKLSPLTRRVQDVLFNGGATCR